MIYFDNAATSKFKPQSCIDAISNYLKDSSNYSRSTHKSAQDVNEKIVRFRQLIRKTVNLNNSKRIIFTSNCSESLNMAIIGHAKLFSKPIHIISSAFDHNSCLRPIHYLYKTNKAYYTIIYPDNNLKINIDNIYKSISKNTKIIAINHTSNLTSSKIDLDKLKDICLDKKIFLVLDTAQSFGHEFINMDGIGAMCIASHKSLHGPQGAGILILNENFDILPIKFGGSGINSEWLDQPNVYPDGFEVGTQAIPNILGLYESYKYTYLNMQKINKKIDTLSYYMHTKLSEIKDIEIICTKNAPCFAIKHLKKPQSDLFNYLTENNVCTRFGLHCAPLIHSHLNSLKTGLVRVSLGYNNSLNEIDEFISLLRVFNQID